MRVCSCFDANNDVFYFRQMFKYTLLLEMDTYYHIFTKIYDKNQITCLKQNLVFYKKYDIRTSYYSVCNT